MTATVVVATVSGTGPLVQNIASAAQTTVTVVVGDTLNTTALFETPLMVPIPFGRKLPQVLPEVTKF